MDSETICSSQQEQEWIRKYRAALDVPSRKRSKLKAVAATFGNVAKILNLALRSVLTKRASTPIPVASAQATKIVLVPTSTTRDRRLQDRQSPVVKSAAPGKHCSPRCGSARESELTIAEFASVDQAFASAQTTAHGQCLNRRRRA